MLYSWWTHWTNCSNQCSKTKGVVCAILSGVVHIKEPLLLIGTRSLCSGLAGFLPHSLSGLLPYVRCYITK